MSETTPEGWPQECEGHDMCDSNCPHSDIVPTIMCPVIENCLLWNHKTQGCSYFQTEDQPNDDDCAAAHHLHARGLLREAPND